MKRFILYSLSATVALAFGTAARADMYENSTEMDRDPTRGVISPDSDSPYNRAVPGAGASADSMTDAERPNLTGGIISPDSESPNNRVVPGIGAEYYSDSVEEEDDSPTAGVISPDSDGPNNRAVPGAGVDTSDADNAYDEVYEDYREPTTNDVLEDTEATDDAPTDGIISPDSDSPYNRAVPQGGALESDDMMDSEEASPTDGIISPDSDGPNNRVEVEDEPMTVDEADDTDRYYENDSEMEPTEGIISPDSDSPNNREVPGTVR